MKRWFSALLTVVIVLGAAQAGYHRPPPPEDEPPVPHSLSLVPVTAEGPIPGVHRVVATVLDRDRNPLEGVEVTFVVAGVHRVTGRAVTDGRGKAPFSYPGTSVGIDPIVVFAGDLIARATMRWFVPPKAIQDEIEAIQDEIDKWKRAEAMFRIALDTYGRTRDVWFRGKALNAAEQMRRHGQRAIDMANEAYNTGATGAKYNPWLPYEGRAWSDGEIEIGNTAFLSPSWLLATKIHEGKHREQFRLYPDVTREELAMCHNRRHEWEIAAYRAELDRADDICLSKPERDKINVRIEGHRALLRSVGSAANHPAVASAARVPEVPSPTFTIQWFDLQKQGTYAPGEPVEVLMILTNETPGPITVNRRFAVNERGGVEVGLGEVYFIIRDPADNPVLFLPLARIWFPEAEDFTTLQAGEMALWITELTLLYNLTSPGVYTVQAVYRSEIVPAGIKAWVGTLTSNTLTLTIR